MGETAADAGPAPGTGAECADAGAVPGPGGPALAVIYLLEADDADVTRLRERI